MKIKKSLLLVLLFLFINSYNVQARELMIYVNNQLVKRDIQSVNGFDMLPILDISEELGYSCEFDGTTAILKNDVTSYTFKLGSPAVFDQNGTEYGLDIVPQFINGKFMIPAKFFQDVLHKSYGWDEVTETLFLGSGDAYLWLISTPEYQEAKKINDVKKAICGVWQHVDKDNSDCCTYIEFKDDGTFYYGYSRGYVLQEYGVGTYTISSSDNIAVNYYVCFRKGTTYDYEFSTTDSFRYTNNNMISSIELEGYDLSQFDLVYERIIDALVVFAPDYKMAFVCESDINAWLNVGWYTHPVTYVYAPDGRCEIISTDDVVAWESVGWTTNPNISMYALDGRVEQVKMWEVHAWESVGWYTEPVIKMYSETGKVCVVKLSEINSYKTVGWNEAYEIVLGKSLNQINKIFGGIYYWGMWEGGYIYKSQDMGFGFPINPSNSLRGCTYFSQPLYKFIPESIIYADDNGDINAYTLSKNTDYLCEASYNEAYNLDCYNIYLGKYILSIDCDKNGGYFNIFDFADLYLSEQI